MKDSQIIAAVEIGTAKVVVLLGEVLQGRRLNIIGMGETASEGICKGEIIDFKAASAATHTAIEIAEKTAKTRAQCIYVAQTGSHLQGVFHSATVNVSSSDSIVSQSDIDRVINEAKNKQLGPGRVYIHHIQNGFQLDGRPLKKVLGNEGQQLSVGYWSVHADIQRLKEAIHIINGFGLSVEDVILSSLASASMVTTETERSSGVLVIDLGAGMTDYALYRGGFVIRTGTLPIGGDHLTNDLSLGLRLNTQRAEELKCEMGKARLNSNDEHESLWLIGDKSIGDRPIAKRTLLLILEARCREIFSIIKSTLKDVLDPSDLPAGVILTGGTALFTEIDKVAEEELGLPVRLGENPSWLRDDLRLPSYSTVLGLLNYALNAQTAETAKQAPKRQDVLHRLAKLFHLAY